MHLAAAQYHHGLALQKLIPRPPPGPRPASAGARRVAEARELDLASDALSGGGLGGGEAENRGVFTGFRWFFLGFPWFLPGFRWFSMVFPLVLPFDMGDFVDFEPLSGLAAWTVTCFGLAAVKRFEHGLFGGPMRRRWAQSLLRGSEKARRRRHGCSTHQGSGSANQFHAQLTLELIYTPSYSIIVVYDELYRYVIYRHIYDMYTHPQHIYLCTIYIDIPMDR